MEMGRGNSGICVSTTLSEEAGCSASHHSPFGEEAWSNSTFDVDKTVNLDRFVIDGIRKYQTRNLSSGKTIGYIYYLKCKSFVKIGFSIDPQSRQNVISLSLPFDCKMLACVPSHRGLEYTLHGKFDEYRHKGEWFHLSPEIKEHISSWAKPRSVDLGSVSYKTKRHERAFHPIRRWRVSVAGWSLERFSKETGICTAVICAIELGKINPTEEDVMALSQVTGLAKHLILNQKRSS